MPKLDEVVCEDVGAAKGLRQRPVGWWSCFFTRLLCHVVVGPGAGSQVGWGFGSRRFPDRDSACVASETWHGRECEVGLSVCFFASWRGHGAVTVIHGFWDGVEPVWLGGLSTSARGVVRQVTHCLGHCAESRRRLNPSRGASHGGADQLGLPRALWQDDAEPQAVLGAQEQSAEPVLVVVFARAQGHTSGWRVGLGAAPDSGHVQTAWLWAAHVVSSLR